jgi:hypothetical protein
MNKNLLDIIRLMLFLTDEQPLWDEVDKINFKKHGWWKKYHWTERMEEKFIELMADKLKKQWKGIVDTKPTTVNKRRKIAEDFVFNYGPVIRELNSNDFMSVVPFSQLDEVMSKRERDAFDQWMLGQTSPLYGVYRGDLERWLNHQKCID